MVRIEAPSKSGSTQRMDSNIKVVVRVRPPNQKELGTQNRPAVEVIDDRMLVFDPKEVDVPFFYHGTQQPTRGFPRRPNKELQFVFDRVCSPEDSNSEVFAVTTRDILGCLMEGYNCSVFAYGATGAGKTYTMLGSKEHPGITYLTMDHLFCMIQSCENDREFDIAVSYIEVYNENVYDLLKPSKYPLQLREDNKLGVMVAGLTLHNIKTARELLNMLENGNKNRTQHPTDANAESSRSHAVFQVYVNMRYKTSSEQRVVKLSMIDLAGSERASATGCVGERFKEGANINKSLLSLGNCINKLADGSKYIPYRDSKLTRLLKDSLGGNCRTVMIANVSPSSISYEDTYNTLKYAARANKIQLSIKKNIVDGNVRVGQYVKMNEELVKKVKELETRLTQAAVVKVVEKQRDTSKEKEWRERISELDKSHTNLESKLLGLMSRQHVLALRHKLRVRAFCHVADLAHRSSSEAVDQMYTEDIPRQERAAEHYPKQAEDLQRKVMSVWAKWKQSRDKLDATLNQALTEVPELEYYVKYIMTQNKMRQMKSEINVLTKLLAISNDEINASSNYMTTMPSMLKKLYLMLKGYDKVTPSLTEEYLDVMKTVKSGKGITWSDTECPSSITVKLDLENPGSIPDQISLPRNNGISCDNTVSEFGTDSELSTDLENREPVKLSAKKRKATPIKIEVQNDTIVIDDSIDEAFNATRTMSSGKKAKKNLLANLMSDIENYDHTIDPKDLNSTFVLAGKLDINNKKQPVKPEVPKKGLTDRTNVQRTLNFNERVGGGRIMKPLPKRPWAPVAPQMRGGFGSSLARDGTPLARNNPEFGRYNNIQRTVGLKAVRSRERMQNHPYTRPLGRTMQPPRA